MIILCLAAHLKNAPRDAAVAWNIVSFDWTLPIDPLAICLILEEYGHETGASAATMADDRNMKEQDLGDRYLVTEQVGHFLRKAYQRHLSIFQSNASDPDLISVRVHRWNS